MVTKFWSNYQRYMYPIFKVKSLKLKRGWFPFVVGFRSDVDRDDRHKTFELQCFNVRVLTRNECTYISRHYRT